MGKIDQIVSGSCYHVFNCGINGTNLYNEPKDFEHFLRLYDKYINPIADTFAWCLMNNHFHLLIRIKEDVVYKISPKDKLRLGLKYEDLKWETIDVNEEEFVNPKMPNPSKHFSHLFNAYARYFNLKYDRHGSLFERPFKRKQIDNDRYFKNVVLYIHNNPVHHGYKSHPIEWAWSSYSTFLIDN